MKKPRSLPCVGITLGDPAGIGPEVIAHALTDDHLSSNVTFALIGDKTIFNRYVRKLPKNVLFSYDLNACRPHDISIGHGDKISAEASLRYIDKAIDLLKHNAIHAIVTGPVSKEGISQLGKHFQGHTEYLAEAFGVKNFEMMFVGGNLRTIVVTRHVPLKQVSRLITTVKVFSTIQLAHGTLANDFRTTKPRIAVCGLNPHAGEGGSIGKEEIDHIIPAIQLAQKAGMQVQGPFPADTIFCPHLSRQFDVIISMYHDQGLVAIKALHFARLVNMTVGLPFIRTSPAHGTAFNIAGQNKADPSSMKAALRLAAQLVVRSHRPGKTPPAQT